VSEELEILLGEYALMRGNELITVQQLQLLIPRKNRRI
jgi:hypothetical protein